MKITVIKTLLLLSLALPKSVLAQKKDNNKYKEEAEIFRKEVWGWNKPEFAVRTIPAEFANFSRVVIARHAEINADSKKKSSVASWGFAVYRQASLTEIVREAVKINDKSALDEYSEISFAQLERKSRYVFNDVTKAYVGIRVYKANGSFKEVNPDEVVLTKDEKNKKEAKIAVPDLQIGDIIDYFIATQHNQEAQGATIPPYLFTVFDDCPVMSYSIHGEFGPKYAVEYRCYNKVPDFKISKNDGDNVLDLQVKNIPAYAELNLWSSPFRQLPIIRMNVLLPYKGLYAGRYNQRKQGQIYKDQTMDEFVQDEKISISNHKLPNAKSMFSVKDLSMVPSVTMDYFKELSKNKSDIPADSVAAELFYIYRYSNYLDIWDGLDVQRIVNRGSTNINSSQYMYEFGDFLKIADIDNKLVFVTPRSGPVLNEIMGTGDINYLLQVDGKKQRIFGMEDIYTLPYFIPAQFEGAKQAITLDTKGRKTVKPKDFDEGVTNVSETKSDENSRIEKIMLVPSADGSTLQVNRTTTLKGHYKSDIQSRLILTEDYCNSERKAFGINKTIIEELQEGKKSKKYAEELKTAFDQARSKQKDAFTSEAKDWFEQDITDISDYKVENLGVRHTSPDFIYSSKFKMSGIIKKAGNNYILEIGKLQGSPLKIDANQRKRKLDVYMPFARSLNLEVSLQIPPGYTVEGVEGLNKKVENETGYFITTATTDGKTVTIKMKKSYDRAFEPSANWDKLLAFIDAANDWTNAKLLLKKK
jgi:hypothetical protein